MENLDLVQILKNCPEGTKLYSPLFGEVLFDCIDDDCSYPISTMKGSKNATFTREGKYFVGYSDGECMLFPSRDQRDWSKFKAPREDLPIDTPIMVSESVYDYWAFGYYAGNGMSWSGISKSVDGAECYPWGYIIPLDKFNPDNIGDCVEKYNYGTKKD